MQQITTTDNMVNANQFIRGLETFGIRLFYELAKTNREKNVVFSPFSIQTCLAMARMGAENETALVMDQVLGLSAQSVEELAKNYNVILAPYTNSSILHIANKIYIMHGYELRETFNELLTKEFFSSAEAVNFADNVAAADTINTWVESKTNNLIKNLIAPEFLNGATRMVLVNAMHFKGEWKHAFPKQKTRTKDFYLDEINTVKVQMMHITETFLFGEFPELDATALEMPYKNSDLSMVIILPNDRTGLVNLEDKLKNVALSDLIQHMYRTKVIVEVPKFKAEFQVELSDTLMKLGMSRIFSDDAEFGKMLKSKESFKVSRIVHKAFIEVNEQGTEAAAATAMGLVLSSMPFLEEQPKRFNANKPFYYTLVNKSGLVIFKGSVHYF